MRRDPLRPAVAVLAAAGAAVAAYLTYTHFADASIACPIGGGCETVQHSRYAEIAGVPVALLGLLLYGLVLALVARDDLRARTATVAVTLGGTAFAVYLIVIQVAVIGALCAWCVANDVVLTLLAVAALARLRSSAPGAAPSARSGRGCP